MQASVHTFDEQTRAGSVLLDDGREHPFSGEVFGASGLRHVRVGQRVSIELGVDPGRSGDQGHEGHEGRAAHPAITKMWVVGVGDGQPIR